MRSVPLDPITTDNSVLLLIDYQPTMLQGVESGDRARLMNATLAVTKAAAILKVPVVLTSVFTSGNGEFLPSITSLLPEVTVHERSVPGFDALEDETVAAAVKATGRQKLLVAGLWTSMCMAFTSLHGLGDDYEVYGLIDAAGDASIDAHEYGVERMLQAGVVPTTWMPLVSEWMHDWSNSNVERLKRDVFGAYNPLLAE